MYRHNIWTSPMVSEKSPIIFYHRKCFPLWKEIISLLARLKSRNQNYLSQWFTSTLSSILVPSTPKNRRILILLIGTLLLFSRIELFGGQFLSSRFIGNDTPMDFVVLTPIRIDSQCLPRSHHSIMQRINHVKNFGFSERHFARRLRLVITKMGADIKWVSALILHHSLILGFAKLRH